MKQKKQNNLQPLIPPHVLAQIDKILFVTHLAIGDFTYMQNCFRAFSEQFPHIKIDLWVDRRIRYLMKQPKLKDYILFDWLEKTFLFHKIYVASYAPTRFKNALREVRREEYPLVVALGQLQPALYAEYARQMSPKGFVAGMLGYKKPQLSVFEKLDVAFNPELSSDEGPAHISDIYTNWFEQLFGLDIAFSQRAPYINIPKEWISYAKLKFVQWGIMHGDQKQYPAIFINIFANDIKRCWPLDSLSKLLLALQTKSSLAHARFIINVEPKLYAQVSAFLKNYSLRNIFLFTANENFFQLPAIISLCDLVVSVETSVVHLAAACKVPVIALMRKKNPGWVPYEAAQTKVIFVDKRSDWVEDISVETVVQTTQSFL